MTRQLLLDLLPPPAPTLDNFVVGDNHVALDAVRNLQPGRAIYLWGSEGAGRSHLLKARACSADSIYFGPDTSPATLLALANADTIAQRYISIDDTHRLDPDGQAALFALYNRWREAASSAHAFALLVAGDRAPMTMPVREDLRTRLGWDLVFRLEQLSDQERAQALKTQADERGLQLSPEVITWILTHHARDMGRLTALLDALDRYSLERHRAITLPLLKDLLASSRP